MRSLAKSIGILEYMNKQNNNLTLSKHVNMKLRKRRHEPSELLFDPD
jgi:hypothetical protein